MFMHFLIILTMFFSFLQGMHMPSVTWKRKAILFTCAKDQEYALPFALVLQSPVLFEEYFKRKENNPQTIIADEVMLKHGRTLCYSDLELYHETMTYNTEKLFEDYWNKSGSEKKIDIINVSGALELALLTARCAKRYFSRDLIVQIASYMSQPLMRLFKHELLAYKWVNKVFKTENVRIDDERWNILHQHDGTYVLVPAMQDECDMWAEQERRCRKRQIDSPSRTTNGVECCYVTRLCKSRGDMTYFLKTPLRTEHGRNKSFVILQYKGEKFISRKSLFFEHEVYNALFNNDTTLLLFFSPHKHGVVIIQVDVWRHKQFSFEGAITVLCAAHHSSLFLVGTKTGLHCMTLEGTHAVHYMTEEGTEETKCLCRIISVEFSPDDTRFFSCSTDEQLKNSYLTLWDIGNPAKRIKSYSFSNVCIKRAFFACDGEKIVVIKNDNTISLFDGVQGTRILKYDILSVPLAQDFGEIPVVLWSNDYGLLLTMDIPSNQMSIRNSATGEFIGDIPFKRIFPIAMGLTYDGRALVFLATKHTQHKVFRVRLYNDQDITDIANIDHASLDQLHMLWQVYKAYVNGVPGVRVKMDQNFVTALRACIAKFSF